MSEFQKSDVEEANGAITGTLYDFEGWPSGTLAGPGHFLALKFGDLPSGATGAAVGLIPSATGMDLQTLDSDMDAVFKIENKDTQRLYVKIFDGDGKFTIYTYDLNGLKYEEAPGA